MYYYIFQPAKNKQEISKQEDVKAILQKHQVAGEFVTLSLAEKPQDLVKIGLRRGYSTIVAVGDDSLINQVGSGLIGSDYALGAIPMDPNSLFLKITNSKNYEDACLALPQRRIARIDTIQINGKRQIITQAKVQLKSKEAELILVNFDNHYRTEVRITELIVSNIGIELKPPTIKRALLDGLVDIYIPARSEVRGGIWSVFSRLKQEQDKGGSIFHPRQATIQSRKPLKMTLGDETISSPPFEIKAVSQSLNIIVERGKAKKVEKE
jgi:diacylglycerol kinase family enzyme